MSTEHRAPLIEHVRELRARVFWCLSFVMVGGIIGYFVHDRLLTIVQKPIGQTLYYTAPTGALTFIIKICLVFGVLVGLPAIMYHIFSFLGPLLSKKVKALIVFFTVLSVVLAAAGSAFAYFYTLPAALHFLVGFGNEGIKSLITANEYFDFAFAYIIGFAVLFQIPLILLFVNRIHRLPPRKLIASVRYVIVICFVAAAIITPTPDPLNQTLMAAPAIGLYLISTIIVTIINWRYWHNIKKENQLSADNEYISSLESDLFDQEFVTNDLPPKPSKPSQAFMDLKPVVRRTSAAKSANRPARPMRRGASLDGFKTPRPSFRIAQDMTTRRSNNMPGASQASYASYKKRALPNQNSGLISDFSVG